MTRPRAALRRRHERHERHAERRERVDERCGERTVDDGSAIIEFLVLATLMLVPVVYLVVTLGRLQAAAFATQGAAREAARAFVTAADETSGRERADTAAMIAWADQGFGDPRLVSVRIDCAPTCLAPGSQVAVRTSLQVVLPAVPRLVDRFVPARIQVDARHAAPVERFAARGSTR